MGQNTIHVPKWPLSREPRREPSVSRSERDALRAKGLTICPDCNCKIRSKRLAKHKEKCPKRGIIASKPKSVSSNRPTQPVVLTTIYRDGFEFTLLLDGTYKCRSVVASNETAQEKYARVVEGYNRECNRLAEIRTEIDRLALQLQSPQCQLQIGVGRGDRVRIKEGPFENFEGIVEEFIEDRGLVRVMLIIFNRPTPVDLEYWQVERQR